jgi:hypothetical protein
VQVNTRPVLSSMGLFMGLVSCSTFLPLNGEPTVVELPRSTATITVQSLVVNKTKTVEAIEPPHESAASSPWPTVAPLPPSPPAPPQGASPARQSSTPTITPSLAPPPNRPPTVESLEFGASFIPAGSSTSVTVVASDPDGDPLIYIWAIDAGPRPDKAGLEGSGPSALFRSLAVPSGLGKYTLRVDVSDRHGGSAFVTGVIDVVVPSGLLVAGPDFQSTWAADPDAQDRLGFATAAERVKPGHASNPPAAEEAFRNGYMFWYKQDYDGATRIYVLFRVDHTWSSYLDTWQAGVDPEFECTTPPTPPDRGFGKLWCSNHAVADKVGIPAAPEIGQGQMAQTFQNGMMLRSLDYAVNYMLFDDGTWQ